jgi:CRP/FNR family transcriptional regulator, anaerobic regulatory protein
MDNVSPLVQYVTKQIELTKEEEEYFASLLKIKKIKKKQFVEQPGLVSRNRHYVVKGALRAYLIGNDDQEHVISLAIEDWFIGDAGSFISQESATPFVEAMEDSVLIQLSYENEQLLLKNVPKFERYFRIRAQRIAVNVQKRVLSNISQSAEERYEEFSKKYPQLLLRFPLYILEGRNCKCRICLCKYRSKMAW